MKKIIKSLIILFSLLSISLYSQTRIILDTDFGSDADDLGALTMLNYFIEKGECNLLGIMCWSTEKYAVSAIDAVNRYYKHPNIPIGVRKDQPNLTDWNYSKSLADRFDHQLNFEIVPDATVLYRKILAESPDKSIVIVTIGP